MSTRDKIEDLMRRTQADKIRYEMQSEYYKMVAEAKAEQCRKDEIDLATIGFILGFGLIILLTCAIS